MRLILTWVLQLSCSTFRTSPNWRMFCVSSACLSYEKVVSICEFYIFIYKIGLIVKNLLSRRRRSREVAEIFFFSHFNSRHRSHPRFRILFSLLMFVAAKTIVHILWLFLLYFRIFCFPMKKRKKQSKNINRFTGAYVKYHDFWKKTWKLGGSYIWTNTLIILVMLYVCTYVFTSMIHRIVYSMRVL